MAGGNLLDDDAFDRNLRAVRAYEAGTPVRPGLLSADRVVTVRVTGAVDGDGNYPAVVTVKDPAAAGGYADYEACRVCPLNTEALTSGTRYAAGWVGYTAAGLELFQVVGLGGGAGSGGGGTVVAVKVNLSAAGGQSIPNNVVTLHTLDTVEYDSVGGCFVAANPFEIIIPSAGYYRLGASVLWDVSAAGVRILQIHTGTNTGLDSERGASVVNPVAVYNTGQFVIGEAHLVPGEYVRLWVLQSSGGALASMPTATFGSAYPDRATLWFSKIN